MYVQRYRSTEQDEQITLKFSSENIVDMVSDQLLMATDYTGISSLRIMNPGLIQVYARNKYL